MLRYAAAGDFILVTNNASDFRRLYADQPLHAGLIILVPTVRRPEQCRLFQAALAEIVIAGEPINQVIEVDVDQGVIVRRHDLPSRAD